MSKNFKKKNILTEDAFNANGNSHVDSDVLNETNETADINENEDELTEDISNQGEKTILDENVNDDELEDVIKNEETDDEIIVSKEDSEEVENIKEINDENEIDSTEISNENKENSTVSVKKIKKIIKKRARGFNDESYYI